jgi:type IV pilus assembly protein PilV
MIEVMMAIGVLSAGAVGMMAMIQASTRGNMEARQLSTASQLAQVWVERLRRDALNWTRFTTVTDPTLLTNTTYLSNVPDIGTPSTWFVPTPDPTSSESATFDYYGQDTTDTAQMHYCTNIRLEWLYVGRAMRADTRVWWLRREAGGTQDATRLNLAACGGATDPNTLSTDWRVRMAYASTVIRFTPTAN